MRSHVEFVETSGADTNTFPQTPGDPAIDILPLHINRAVHFKQSCESGWFLELGNILLH